MAWILAGLLVSGSADYLWWEGESPAEANFPKKTWFSASTFERKRHVLSGGDWLTNADKRKGEEAYARYRIHLPSSGNYTLWARKFWKHGPFRWRFDRKSWRVCGGDIALADSVEIRKFLCVNWVSLGKVTLTAGPHSFELRLLAGEGEALTACFDCFLLTKTPFFPRGKLKPGEKSGRADEGFWAFEPDVDGFGKAKLDLRPLNERTAGEWGFVRREGGQFVLGDGEPVRFWGVNCGPGVVMLDHDSLGYLARRLAKVGVNIVRFHGPLFDRNSPDPTKMNEKLLDHLHYFVAALKEQGIYVKLSFYFPLWFRVKRSYGVPGYDAIKNKKPFALLYFDPRMQEIYKAWARALLLTKNPYTGVSFAKEPAVAIIELVNEDSYFFWTFNEKNIPRPQMEKLESLFGAWLSRKYGSVEKALASWGGARQKRDSPADARAGLLGVWHLTSKGCGEGSKRRRMSDQLRFLAGNQREFYGRMVGFFREELGSKSLISCSNWKTADAKVLDPIERYTYTAGDLIDRHGYFGGRHKGPRASFSVGVGDTFADRAGVREPAGVPVQFNLVEGYPHIISEIGWTNPNRFKAEFPFLCATYGSLQGADGFFFFAASGPDWEYSPKKFPLTVPTIMGQFPATALIYRRGDVREGETVVRDVLDLKGLYDFKGGAAMAAQSPDELRRADVPPGGVARGRTVTSIDPLAFYVGRVLRSFGRERSKAVLRDLRRYIDRDGKLIRSSTGEIVWDYGRGVVRLDAPKAQGATGFLGKAGRIDLKDVAIESGNEFGTVLVVSLDEKPISRPRRLLIQAMTEERCWGWRVEGDRVADLGGYPMTVRNVDATVTLKRAGLLKNVHVLDEHGYVRERLRPLKEAGRMKIKLARDAMYTIVE